MFKLIHKNRKGISLVEVLVTLVVLGLVLPLAGGILYSLTNLNNTAVDKWDVQTATRLACRDFESNSDGLINAYQVDIIYDPVIESGVTLKNDGTIEWKSGSDTYVMNPEGIDTTSEAHKSDVYTYVFSARTWDENGVYLGELLYERSYGDPNSHLLLNDYGLGNIPVSVTFSMGTTKSLGGSDYTDSNVLVHFSSGLEDVEFNYDAAFAVVNNKRNINFMGGALVCEEDWVVEGVPKAYPAGWDNYYINTNADGLPEANSDGTYTTNCVIDETTVKISETFDMAVTNEKDEPQYDSDSNLKTEKTSVIARQANVLRYKSPEANKTHGDSTEHSSNTNVASCLSGFAMAGSANSDEVLDNLRMFRDNVLRGTEIGDWIIHEYYYTWSPFLIEHTAFLKPVYQAILVPVSYVCEFISKL